MARSKSTMIHERIGARWKTAKIVTVSSALFLGTAASSATDALKKSPANETTAAPAPRGESDCRAPGPIPMSLLNPVGVRSYLENSSLSFRDPGDFICCLPREVRSNFIIAHSSIAAQPGTPTSPRVVFRDPSDPSRDADLQFAFSVNGGVDGQRQGQNIEFVFQNRTHREYELFDARIGQNSETPQNRPDAHRLHISSRNPDECLACHGSSSGTPGGPRLIFQANAWPRFVGGSGLCRTPTENQLIARAERHAVQAVLENPRFRCLEFSDGERARLEAFARSAVTEEDSAAPSDALTNLRARVSRFDSAVEAAFARRLYTDISRSTDFNQFKFVLAGALKGCGTPRELLQWIPTSRLATMRESAAIQNRLLRESVPNADVIQTVVAQGLTESLRLRENQEHELRREGQSTRPVTTFDGSPFACLAGEPPNARHNARRAFERDLGTLLTPNPVLNRYLIDSAIGSHKTITLDHNSHFDGFIRFLFESRGISLADHHTEPDLGTPYQRSARRLIRSLINGEPPNSELRKALESNDATDESDATPRDVAAGRVGKAIPACRRLRRLSLQALSTKSNATADSPGARPMQPRDSTDSR